MNKNPGMKRLDPQFSQFAVSFLSDGLYSLTEDLVSQIVFRWIFLVIKVEVGHHQASPVFPHHINFYTSCSYF